MGETTYFRKNPFMRQDKNPHPMDNFEYREYNMDIK